jgi:alkylated DNA repair dioxygenase AlkB
VARNSRDGLTLSDQGDLFGPAAAPPSPAAPAGFGYWDAVIAPEAEAALVRLIETLPLKPFDFHGWQGNRRVVSFGHRYDYGERAVADAPAAPPELIALRDVIAPLADRPASAFVQIMVSEYAPGAGIGWHRDKPQFGVVVGVSLLAPCVLRFRRKAGDQWRRASARLAPRSAYVLDGPARRDWQHSITPMETLRYSITFRTLA